jgi:hypothetical protein
MKRTISVLTLCVLLFTLCGFAKAQQTGKVPRIGYLDSSTASTSAVGLEAFWQDMRKLGWIEGKNIDRYLPASTTIQFWIFDWGEKTRESNFLEASFRFLLRQSEI